MSFADVAALTIHNVKNRLSILAGRAEQAGDEVSVNGLLEASQSLTQLLTLYKSDTGQLQLNIEAHCPEDMVRELVRETGTLTAFTVHADLAHAPLLAFYDEPLLRMVLADAIHNAMRYARTQIVVGVSACAEGVEFFVRDDGPGYPAGLLSADVTPGTTDGSSTGLGVILARQIAQLHQNDGRAGSVSLANKGGAVFTIRVPA